MLWPGTHLVFSGMLNQVRKLMGVFGDKTLIVGNRQMPAVLVCLMVSISNQRLESSKCAWWHNASLGGIISLTILTHLQSDGPVFMHGCQYIVAQWGYTC